MKRSFCNNRASYSVRSGYTLLEMMAVIALMGFVMSILASILVFCMRTERTFSTEARKMQVINSLATDLRNDIHQLDWKQIRIDEEGHSLHLADRVTYRWKDERIWREINDQKNRQESYWFPKDSVASWSKDDASNMITLQIEMPTRIAANSKTERKTFRSLTIKAQAERYVMVNKGESP